MNRRNFLKTLPPVVLGLNGCLRRNNKVSRNFPDYVRSEMHGELNRARDVINHVGIHNVRPRGVEAKLIQGHRKTGGIWAWRATHPGFPGGAMWVRGLCYGPRIEVARNSNLNAHHEVHWPTVHHEFVHHWLMQNNHGPNHFPEYDRLVSQWAYARSVVGFSIDDDIKHQEIKVDDLSKVPSGIVHFTLEVDGRPVAVNGYIPDEDEINLLEIENVPTRPIQFYPWER